MGIDEDGYLWGCGSNILGQLGIGNLQFINRIEKISDVSCGYNFTMAIDKNGILWASGENYYGQLGLGDNRPRNIFEQVSNEIFISVSCGDYHVIAIDAHGVLYGAGNNLNGQLGLGHEENRSIFEQVPNQFFRSVCCGDNYTMGIDQYGYLWGCGANDKGQLGLGDNIIEGNQFTNVNCGKSCTIAIDTNGHLWICGDNLYGKDDTASIGIHQRSFGTQNPQRLYGVRSYSRFGESQGDQDFNDFDDFYIGNIRRKNIFVRISNKRFLTVNCTFEHVIAVDENRYLWVCGKNIWGQ